MQPNDSWPPGPHHDGCKCPACCGGGGSSSTDTLIQDLINAINNMPQVEGLALIRYCDADGNTTGFATVYLPDESDPSSATPLFFDADLQPTAAAPAGEVCTDKQCQYTVQQWKKQEYYVGIENSGTKADQALTIKNTNGDGSTNVIATTAQAAPNAYGPQIDDWEALYKAEYADLCEVAQHWAEFRPGFPTDAPVGGAPPADFSSPALFGRYIQITACANDADKLPISAEITHIDGVKLDTPQQLIVATGVSEITYHNVCVSCDPNCATAEPPKCSVPAATDFPVAPEPACPTKILPAFDCYPNPDLSADDPLLSVPIFYSVDCNNKVTYLILDSDALAPYTLIGVLSNEACEPIAITDRPDCGNYTGRKKCFEIKGGFRLIEKQFAGANGSVDVSAEFGLPAGSIIATINTNLWTGANSDLIAVGPDDTATFSVSGSQAVCIRVQHGGSIPTDGGKDGFIAGDGVPYTFTGSITGDGVVNQNGNTYAVKAGTDNFQGVITWTSNGPATSATAWTSNQNPLNAVRFWIAPVTCIEVREWISCDGSVCGWYDGKTLVDITGLTESDCCDKPVKTVLDDAMTECCDGETLTYTNTDNTTELSVSVSGSADIIKIGLSATTPGTDATEAQAIADYITQCLANSKNVDITWQTAPVQAGDPVGVGQGTITAQNNAFPNFSGNGTFTWSNGTTPGELGQNGKLTNMTATCAGECKKAVRTKDCGNKRRDELLEQIAINTAALVCEQACVEFLLDGRVKGQGRNFTIGGVSAATWDEFVAKLEGYGFTVETFTWWVGTNPPVPASEPRTRICGELALGSTLTWDTFLPGQVPLTWKTVKKPCCCGSSCTCPPTSDKIAAFLGGA